MKRFISSLSLALYVFSFSLSIAEGSFDFSLFSSKSSPYYSVFDEISYEDEYAFITPSLTYDELEITNDEVSPYYYSTMSPDILVIDHGTVDEKAVFRIEINYTSELPAIKPFEATVAIGENRYCFDVSESTDSYATDAATNTDSTQIIFNSDSLLMMKEWCNAVDNDDPISVILTGETRRTSFNVPDTVAMITALTYNAYVSAGGLKSIDRVLGTPIRVEDVTDNSCAILNSKDKLNGQTVYIDSIDGAISFPVEYFIFEKNMEVTSPVLSTFGLSSIEVNELLEELGLEYDILSEDGAIEFTVSITDAYGFNFNSIDSNSEFWINMELRSSLASKGFEIKEAGFVNTPYTRMWRAHTVLTGTDNTKTYSLQYYVTNNEKYLELSVNSYGVAFTSFQKEMCDNIANTIRFGENAIDRNTILSTERFKDSSNSLSATFSIPSLWYTESVSAKYKDQYLFKAKPYGGHGVILEYGLRDFYQYSVDTGKPPASRKDVFKEDNFDISDEEIQTILETYDMSEDAYVDYLQIGENKYFLAFQRQSMEYGESNVASTLLTLTHCDTDTGILHMFVYIADDTNFELYLGDVIGIIESAHYPSQD